jgi:hypothetical protein
MIPGIPTSRERAAHRRSLYLLIAGLAAAAGCLLIDIAEPGREWAPTAGASPGAPPETAIRPNAPTEPVMGSRVDGPGG